MSFPPGLFIVAAVVLLLVAGGWFLWPTTTPVVVELEELTATPLEAPEPEAFEPAPPPLAAPADPIGFPPIVEPDDDEEPEAEVAPVPGPADAPPADDDDDEQAPPPDNGDEEPEPEPTPAPQIHEFEVARSERNADGCPNSFGVWFDVDVVDAERLDLRVDDGPAEPFAEPVCVDGPAEFVLIATGADGQVATASTTWPP